MSGTYAAVQARVIAVNEEAVCAFHAQATNFTYVVLLLQSTAQMQLQFLDLSKNCTCFC